MVRKINYMVLFVALACMVACATTSFNQRSYQILKTSHDAYDLVTDGIIDLHNNGLISDKDYAKIEAKADTYADVHNEAVNAVKAFKRGLMTAEETGNKVAAVSVALADLLKIAQPYILKMEE